MRPQIVFISLVVLVAAAPQGGRQTTTPVPILEYVNQSQGDGNYQFRFKTGNDIDREEEGALKDVVVTNGDGQDEVKRVNVVRGVIRYPKDDGTFYELSYIADELGFRPVSSDIPAAPLP